MGEDRPAFLAVDLAAGVERGQPAEPGFIDDRAGGGAGVPGQRDPAVVGDDQAQAGEAQAGAFLPGLAPLRGRRLLIAGVGEGREVRHVLRHR